MIEKVLRALVLSIRKLRFSRFQCLKLELSSPFQSKVTVHLLLAFKLRQINFCFEFLISSERVSTPSYYSDFTDSNKKLLQTNDNNEIPIFLHYYENKILNSKFIFYPSDYKVSELLNDLPKIFDDGLQFDNLISQVQELLKP